MEAPSEHFILALGRGYHYREGSEVPVGICTAGAIRAQLALDRAFLLKLANPQLPISLVAAAGREARRKAGPTMAALTRDFWTTAGNDFPLVINTRDCAVWSTFAEIEWLVAYLEKHVAKPYTVEIVAAPRQDRRTRYLLRKFFPELRATVLTSAEEPIPLYHEAFGYLKLWLYGCGLRSILDWLRRWTARPIAEQNNHRPPR